MSTNLMLGTHLCKTKYVEKDMLPEKCKNKEKFKSITVKIDTIQKEFPTSLIIYYFLDNGELKEAVFIWSKIISSNSKIYEYTTQINGEKYKIMIKNIKNNKTFPETLKKIKAIKNYSQYFVDIVYYDGWYYMNGIENDFHTFMRGIYYYYSRPEYLHYYYYFGMFILKKIFDGFYILDKNNMGYYDAKPDNVFYYCSTDCFKIYIGDIDSIVEYGKDIDATSFCNLKTVKNYSECFVNATKKKSMFNFGIFVIYILYFIPKNLHIYQYVIKTKNFNDLTVEMENLNKNILKHINKCQAFSNVTKKKIITLLENTTIIGKNNVDPDFETVKNNIIEIYQSLKPQKK